jgi:uncharacterized protein (TIGR03118 family)
MNRSKLIVSGLALSIFLSNPLPVFAKNQCATQNSYVLDTFVANKEKYKPAVVIEDFINAWGIAIRPKGAGGHFWVTAKDKSFEYLGDVRASSDPKLQKLHTDDLKVVTLPVGGDENFATGTVFNGSDKNFTITQNFKGGAPITAPAKFLFASDGGIISAWTERKKADGTVDHPSEAISVIDESKNGSQFFGLAISHDYSKLYAADFGSNPTIHTFDGAFKPVSAKFDNPFDTNNDGRVTAGEYAPFNIQALTTPAGQHHLFVAYAKTQSCPEEEVKKGSCAKGELFVGEEDSGLGKGRVAEFTEEGKLVALWHDGDKLDAPWGLVFAPDNFGVLSGALLVANFGDGLIAGYDAKTRTFIDYLRDTKGKPLKVDKAWGLLFGNGESLGDSNALYVAAGPEDEADGLFGAIRHSPKKGCQE